MSSFDIAPVAYMPVAPVNRPTRLGAGTGAASAVRASQEAVTVDTIPSNPPAEVLHAIGAAARAYDRLKASGRELQFEADDQTQRVRVNVRDPQGWALATISPSQALDAAVTGDID